MPENKIVIGYETLFELLRLERSRTELQEFPKEYIVEVNKLLEADLTGVTDEEERQKIKIHLANTLKIINEIYERRERKIVQMALTKSKTKAALVDFSKFLEHEKKTFQQVLDILDKERQDFISKIKPESKKQVLFEEAGGITVNKEQEKPILSEMETKNDLPQEPTLKAVKFLSPLSKFLGPELEEYGPFVENDIATLPTKITEILVNRKKAEYL